MISYESESLKFENVKKLILKSETTEEAEVIAARFGYYLTVGKEDGECFPIISIFDPTRIIVTVENYKVVEVKGIG